MTFRLNRLTHCPDVSPADWIAPRLTPAYTEATSVVPTGFAAYARVFHAVSPDQADRVTWADVARGTGRVAHPLMQWHAISKGSTGEPDWAGGEAQEGELDPRQLAALCSLLREHTSTADACYHAIWNGFGGWVSGSSTMMLVTRPWWRRKLPWRSPMRKVKAYVDSGIVAAAEPPPHLPAEVTEGPVVRHPHRDYFLFAGPVEAAQDFVADRGGNRDRLTPQLLWPADHAWCVATEIDFDSTLVGGPRVLVDAIVADTRLEAMPIEPDADLTRGGDTVNDPDGSLSRG